MLSSRAFEWRGGRASSFEGRWRASIVPGRRALWHGARVPNEDLLARARAHLAFALDVPTLEAALPLAEAVGPEVGVLKVGLELFVAEGPAVVRRVREAAPGARLFLDLKLHDIPETVARAVDAATALGVDLLTVHASGGAAMLERAAERARAGGTTLLAVTALTSLDASDLEAIGVSRPPGEQVLVLGRLALGAGAHGLVCAAPELASLRRELGPGPVLVTPGVRPAEVAAGDQKRVTTPAAALLAGSSLLVVGRPIRDAARPAEAARNIVTELASALERGAS